MLSLASALVATQPAAWAQPVDPYAGQAPTPTPTPTATPTPTPHGTDPEIDLAVAQALLARARVLDAEASYADAKQLVVEALMRAPGDADAKLLLAELNRKLGIVDAPPPPPLDPIAPPYEPPPDDRIDTPEPTPPSPQRPTRFARYAGGVVGGAIAGGLFADVVTGLDGTTADDVTGGAILGALGGGLTAHVLNKSADLTVGDHALIDSMATWGLLGGMMFAFALDPPEGEAFSLNGVVGIGGGYLIGHAAARKSDLSTARLARVNAAALIGAAAPWLLYAVAEDPDSTDDEQAFGFLSTVGLLSGVYLGFRWTRNMKPAGEVPTELETGPTALFRHGRAGWDVGGLGMTRVQGGRGAALSLVGGSW